MHWTSVIHHHGGEVRALCVATENIVRTCPLFRRKPQVMLHTSVSQKSNDVWDFAAKGHGTFVICSVLYDDPSPSPPPSPSSLPPVPPKPFRPGSHPLGHLCARDILTSPPPSQPFSSSISSTSTVFQNYQVRSCLSPVFARLKYIKFACQKHMHMLMHTHACIAAHLSFWFSVWVIR